MASTQTPSRETFCGVRLTLQSKQSFETVHARIMTALHAESFKPGDLMREGAPVFAKSDRAVFEEFINGKVGPYGFMLFDVLTHSRWLEFYNPNTQKMASYTLGNPLLARPLFQRFAATGLHVPFRIHLQSMAESDGCCISWDVPSSVISVDGSERASDVELRRYMEALDARLETLVRDVMAN